MATNKRLRAIVTIILILSFVIGNNVALAWKPYTHSYTGDQVEADLQSGDHVIINGHSYNVRPEVAAAIRNYPTFYNAGVIGPDGFPDIAYGQAIIHPVHTGLWLRYIYEAAWAAQTDPSYSAEQKAQILAWTYGFLTHAAGDMWGHTLINDFAQGVFPSVTEIPTSARKALIALRHIIVEAYIGSATPGWDNLDKDLNDEVTQVCHDPSNPPPGTTCLVSGPGGSLVPDVSEDKTHGIPFDVPSRFIYNTLIDYNAPTPSDPPLKAHGRGAIIDAFFDLEAKLQIQSAKYDFDIAYQDCTTLDPDCKVEPIFHTVDTVEGPVQVQVGDRVCHAAHFCLPDPTDDPVNVVKLGINSLLKLYVDAWAEDIDTGLQHWPEFSLAVARGLFDPQTRRDAQNEACSYANYGPETTTNIARNECEAGVGYLDTVIYALDHVYPDDDPGGPSFINRYLIPMLGLPDAFGDIREFLKKVGGAIDDLFTFLGISNPIEQLLDTAKQYVEEKFNEYINDKYGIDLEALDQFDHKPSQWMCGDDGSGVSIILPGIGITITPSGMFSPAEHARLDALMGLPPDHHAVKPGLPADCGPLKDDAEMMATRSSTTFSKIDSSPCPAGRSNCVYLPIVTSNVLSGQARVNSFEPGGFAPLKNTVTTAKLLLLDGPELNHALGDALVDGGWINDARLVNTYGVTETMMIDADGGPTTYWLELIDGDHAWRQDGLPRFCDPSGPNSCTSLPPDLARYSRQPTPRYPGELNGGNGNFPIWKNCLLRPAFRELFTDWENSENTTETNFPDLGDDPSLDPNGPITPTSTLSVSGPTYTSGGKTFISSNHTFTLSATDTVFRTDKVNVQYRFYKDGTTPGDWQTLPNGGTFAIPANAGDGIWHVDYRAEDPCHTFKVEGGGPEQTHTATYILDTTPPVITINQPTSTQYVHSAVLTLDYTVDDGQGSGVKSFTPLLDGADTLAGHGLASGQTINLLTELTVGPHTFTINAVDNVENASTSLVTFAIIVTADSIRDDVNQFFSAGAIKNQGLANSLLAKLDAAADARGRGDCTTTANIYQAFINELEAQSGKGIDATAAAIMTTDAQYLIAHCS